MSVHQLFSIIGISWVGLMAAIMLTTKAPPVAVISLSVTSAVTLSIASYHYVMRQMEE